MKRANKQGFSSCLREHITHKNHVYLLFWTSGRLLNLKGREFHKQDCEFPQNTETRAMHMVKLSSTEGCLYSYF